MIKNNGYKSFSKFCFLLIATSLLLTACFGPAAAPQMTTYQLQDVSQQKITNRSGCATLLVMMPSTNANYQSKNMFYSLDQYQTQPFAKHQWAASPPQMLLPLLMTSLTNSNYFHAVVTTPFAGKADYQLTTQLTQFQQYFSDDSDASYFKMRLFAVLINNKTHRVIAERRFDATVTAPERSPYGGVIAANQATASILQQLTVWTVKQLRAGIYLRCK